MSIAEHDFQFISELVKKESAISLEKGKEYLVDSRLSPLASEEGYENLSALVLALRANQNIALTTRVVEALTTNETSFFRDVDPFEMMKAQIIPELIEKRKAERKLTVWCGAASSGQELYSFAMLIRENFPELAGWDIKIVGTDINKQILDRARRGEYSQVEVNRGLPAPLLIKYFKKEGSVWQVKQELRDMIEFREMNLIKTWFGLPQCDIVLLRNVLIYFETEVKKEILAKVRKLMKPDGYLFLGSAETTLNLDPSFDRRSLARGSCYVLNENS